MQAQNDAAIGRYIKEKHNDAIPVISAAADAAKPEKPSTNAINT
ncbi:hypothetical protein [Methanocella conradii]|nr:hypothetical protein [Methanocella conradii]